MLCSTVEFYTGGTMNDTTLIADARVAGDHSPAEVVFGTLSDLEFETMTDGGVEFVLCASALTAQM